MSRKINHLPETYHFDKDFSIDSLPDILGAIVQEFYEQQQFVLDLTTVQGDYHYNIDLDELR